MSNSESDIEEKESDFGSMLAEARKAKNYTVDQISEHIKIPAHFITAIEGNNIAALPNATFAQGYIRAYARFLEISENNVIELYKRSLPQEQATSLKPRSNLRGEASSQSPLIKSITMLLIFAGIAAAVYGSFQYYQEKADALESEREFKERSFTGNSLDSPGVIPSSIQQDADATEDDNLIVEQSDTAESASEENFTESEPVNAESSDETAAPIMQDAPQNEEVSENDVIEIFAENGSWVELRDASTARLFYNMIPKGGRRVLEGKAPFRITLGNAKTTRVIVNDLEVDMTQFIRPNNTASFAVSTEEQRVIFD